MNERTFSPMTYFLKRMVENGFSLKFIINNLIIIMLVVTFTSVRIVGPTKFPFS